MTKEAQSAFAAWVRAQSDRLEMSWAIGLWRGLSEDDRKAVDGACKEYLRSSAK